ncbi:MULTISPECIES: TetR/AcrR family transcriptional regulator [unclassified Bradyrhizobium]|uniref:TetR/AcrR family transcriptional regulator n=1 Tax=unclassified Bradyrhizobium TaxID=2631580 RepID=UPI002FEE8BA7
MHWRRETNLPLDLGQAGEGHRAETYGNSPEGCLSSREILLNEGHHPEFRSGGRHPDRRLQFPGATQVGHSQAEKARSRERILDAAALQLRELGLAGISISELMTSARLTHGGFYGHFESRDDLIAQALDRALADGDASAINAASAKGPRTLKSFLNAYLSKTHRDDPASGCAVAALAGDVARADSRTRDIMTAYLEKSFDSIATLIGDEDATEFATSVMCTIVGAMTLSRVMREEEASKKILLAARRSILDYAEMRRSSRA